MTIVAVLADRLQQTKAAKSGCPTEVALGFTGRVRVRYKREKKESILNAHSDLRGESTNGRGDNTARHITGSTAPGVSRNSAGCAARCGRGARRCRSCATGTED